MAAIRKRERAFVPLLIAGAFCGLPLMALAWTALWPDDPTATRAAWDAVIHRRGTILALALRTIGYAAVSATVAMVIGAPAGAVAAVWRLRYARIAAVLFPAAFIFPAVWHAGALLQWLGGVRFGDGAETFRPFEVRISQGWFPAAGLLAGLWLAPLAAWLTMTVLFKMRTDSGSYEDAALQFASPTRAFFCITLAAAVRPLMGIWLLAAALATGSLAATDLLGVRVFSEEIFVCLNSPSLFPAAAALSLFPAFFAGAALLVSLRLVKPVLATDALDAGRPGGLYCFETRWGRASVETAVVLIAVFFLAFPLSSVFFSQFQNETHSISQILLQASVARDSVLTSARIGLFAGFTATAAAMPIAVFLRRAGNRNAARFLLIALLAFALATPPSAWGAAFHRLGDIAFRLVGGRSGAAYPAYDYIRNQSLILTSFAISARFLPVAVLLQTVSLNRLPDSIFYAADLFDGRAVSLWRSIYWPLLKRPALMSAWIIAALAIGELGCVYLLAPAGFHPATRTLLNALHSMNSSAVSGFGVWFGALAIVFAAGMAALQIIDSRPARKI